MKFRFSIAILSLVVFLALALFSKSGTAKCVLPTCDIDRAFYSDDTFTTQVGDYHVTCQGIQQWGARGCFYDSFDNGECYPGAVCTGLDFRCENGTITSASDPNYIGHSCACYP